MSWSMARKARLAAALSAALGFALTFAPAAHADVRSYHGVPGVPSHQHRAHTPKTNIYTGLKSLSIAARRYDTEQIAQGVTSTADMPGMITAAQHDCAPIPCTDAHASLCFHTPNSLALHGEITGRAMESIACHRCPPAWQ